MEKIYAFMSEWYSDKRPEHPICQGRRSFIEQYIPRREFSELFGGYVLSEDSSGEEFLGVWSRRTAQKFRRILRERGAQFITSSDVPPLRLTEKAVYFTRRNQRHDPRNDTNHH